MAKKVQQTEDEKVEVETINKKSTSKTKKPSEKTETSKNIDANVQSKNEENFVQTDAETKSEKQCCKRNKSLMINIIIGAVGLVVAGLMFLCGCLFGARNGKVGQTGKNGATWYSGINAPTSSIGEVGDFYLDEDDYNIYKRTKDGWVFVSNIKGAQGEFTQFYVGYDGYIWNGTERTVYKTDAVIDETVLENTIGAKESMDKFFNGSYINLYNASIALMAGYNETAKTTKFTGQNIVEISVYAEQDGTLFIGEAKIEDIVSARLNGSTITADSGRNFNVKKGLNTISVKMRVGAGRTIVMGGNESVGVYMFAEVPVSDEAGNYTLVDTNAYDEVISSQNGYADTVLVQVKTSVQEP